MNETNSFWVNNFICDCCGGVHYTFCLCASDLRLGIPTEFDLVKCQSCGLVSVYPYPDNKTMQIHYPDWLWEQQLKRSSSEKLSRKIVVSLETLQQWHREPGYLLDVGCATGDFVLAIQQKGWQAHGLEVNEQQVQMGKIRGADVEVCDNFAKYETFFKYDTITFNHVLEHVPSPREYLVKANNILKPDGILLISVPNYSSLSRRIFGRYWMHLDVPRHLFHFSPKTLIQTLEATGFNILDIKFDDIEQDSIGIRNSLRRWLVHGVLHQSLGSPQLSNGLNVKYSAKWQKILVDAFLFINDLVAYGTEKLKIADTFMVIAAPNIVKGH